MSERTVHPSEYLRMFMRRKIWFIVPFVVCVIGGAALAMLLPPTFKSSARIGVQAPTVEPDLVAARTALDREERLRALSQQLLSPVVLERVAREERLVSDRPIDQVVQSLMGRIHVDVPPPIARTGREPELNAFDIIYLDSTAERTQRVANRLAQVFVEEHSRSREHQAEGTAEFLGSQLRAAKTRIADLERRLRAAKTGRRILVDVRVRGDAEIDHGGLDGDDGRDARGTRADTRALMALRCWSIGRRAVVRIARRRVARPVGMTLHLRMRREGAVHRARRHQARLADVQGEPETDDDREWPKPEGPAHALMI